MRITALILAGGRASRMGGVDKGLQNFCGMPLIAHTLLRLQMQQGGLIAQIMVNANRNLSAYESMGVAVWPDAQAQAFAGPLAGFLTGLAHCETPYLLTVPCDTPLFPLDLAQRLLQGLEQAHADVAVACAKEYDHNGSAQMRAQPVFCLMKTALSESLVRFMQSGGRKIDQWTAQHRLAQVRFDNQGDDVRAFSNINTLEELKTLESCSNAVSQKPV